MTKQDFLFQEMPEIRNSGFYQGEHFIPYSLPPQNPNFMMTDELIAQYGQAMLALGRVNEMFHRLPNKERFLKAYVIKEAMLSSEIEGIYTTTTELFIDQKQITKETQLVQNYIHALQTGVRMIREEQYPLVFRMLNQVHTKLLLGQSFTGSIRTQQVRVGNLLPAPFPELSKLTRDLEIFINEDKTILPLIKAGLAHVQFETIHPYFDGNGRIGRLLIIFILIQSGLLDEPLLYVSYFFKKNHNLYYTKLDDVRQKGDFEGWILFYLQAIYEAAQDACQRAKKIEVLEEKFKSFVSQEVLTILFEMPVFTITKLSEKLGKSYNTTKALVTKLIDKNIIRQSTQKQRERLFEFTDYLNILEQE